jgi:hypothetical protein
VLGPRGQQVYADMISNTPDEPAGVEFDALPADADEPTRQDIAERLTPHLEAVRRANPGLTEFRSDAPGGEQFAKTTIDKAMQELYNPAQLDVLARIGNIIRSGGPEAAAASGDT